jgi:hypothetical protein
MRAKFLGPALAVTMLSAGAAQAGEMEAGGKLLLTGGVSALEGGDLARPRRQRPRHLCRRARL